jgi:hypothetical protein
MSTRTNIVIKDKHDKLFFYRHSDGYPEGTLPTLNIFMDWLTNGKIRNNLSQAAGWLIVLGAMEYNTIPEFKTSEATRYSKGTGEPETFKSPEDWKCGAYEPTTGIHGDIEYLYIIDLDKKTIECFEDWTDAGEGKGTPLDLKSVKLS